MLAVIKVSDYVQEILEDNLSTLNFIVIPRYDESPIGAKTPLPLLKFS